MTREKSNNRGSALVLALGVLALVALFGTAMYRYSSLELDDYMVDLNKDRAYLDAKSGVEHGIAELQAAIASGNVDSVVNNINNPVEPLRLNLYKLANRTPDAVNQTPVTDERYTSTVSLKISDESARMNVNLAPPAVLMSILKIDGEKARQIRERLPRLDGSVAENENRRWLSSVDELASLPLLQDDTAKLTEERKADLTTFTALDIKAPAGFVNLNTASKPVLEAALAVTPEVADKVMLARPLSSLDALVAAAGKGPDTFNFKPAADNPGGMPKELAFSSRCYRIRSEAVLTRSSSGQEVRAIVEAVVQFPENEAPRIVYWNKPPVGAAATTTAK
ncbi:MAG: general secretion pathway protein GspK [Candidatus Hydrogenedentes bacterium]|nr:general secretion pathway protein GspK [Candidatus Hydrogenedentota bacterium]